MAWDDTFNIDPEFVYDVTNGYKVLTSELPSARLHRRAIFTDVLRKFKLQWDNATEVTRNAIRTFFQDTQGGCLPLKWTPPNESSWVRVRFISDSLKWERHTGVLYKVSFVFMELFKGNVYS